jgi:hypothetical protein
MLEIENYFCLCSWIAAGAQISSFIGQTFPMPSSAVRLGRSAPAADA